MLHELRPSVCEQCTAIDQVLQRPRAPPGDKQVRESGLGTRGTWVGNNKRIGLETRMDWVGDKNRLVWGQEGMGWDLFLLVRECTKVSIFTGRIPWVRRGS